MKVKVLQINLSDLLDPPKMDDEEEKFMADVVNGMKEKGGEVECSNPNCRIHGAEAQNKADNSNARLRADLQVLDKEGLIDLIQRLTNNMHTLYYGFKAPEDKIVAAGLRAAYNDVQDKYPAFKAAMEAEYEEGGAVH